MKEASFYEFEGDSSLRCRLCPHNCRIRDGAVGICGVRKNVDGNLYSLVYGKAVAAHVDPIEKKPLFHFFPGSRSFSIATVGCNFHCSFCQNSSISQVSKSNRIEGEDFPPEQVVSSALRYNCKSISYTYTEPTIFYEYAHDSAKLAKEKGIYNNFVTNGFISKEPLEGINPYLDAANVDLKSFSDKTYRSIIGGRLTPVLDTLKLMNELGIWVEVTTLVIPGINDSDEELRDIASFILELGPGTPWHVSRFHPTYRMTDRPSTPIESLRRVREIGLKAGLRYVYGGNMPGEESENTFCYSCGNTLVARYGFSILENNITEDSKCFRCGADIDGVGMGEVRDT